MRFSVRGGCLALCLMIVSQSCAWAQGRSRRVLGVVVQADRGRLDNAVAQLGANVYSCDRLETDPDGVLRVNVSASQLFLAGASLAELEDDGDEIQAIAMRGTVGFSSPASANFSVRTPAGIVRASAGHSAAGQVVYAGPQKLLISAIQGDLTLDSSGELRTIPEGKSAEVTFDTGVEDRCRDQGPADQKTVKPYSRPKIGFFLILGGAAAISSFFIWHETSESASQPSQ